MQECNEFADKIIIKVPGSTANLGPGFDTLALALNVHAELTFTLLPENEKSLPLITASGNDQKSLDKNLSCFLLEILEQRIKLAPQLVKRLHLDIKSEIPIGRGFGSSAAMIIAMLWASDRLLKTVPDKRSLLRRGAAIEGHPDNIAASLLGGLVITSIGADQKTVFAHKLKWPEEWHLILIVPPHSLPTVKARSVLPRAVPHKDAIYNVQHTALLLAAAQSKDEELLKEALHDRLHEKYRADLVPALGSLQNHLRNSQALGCVLSGAGSSVLVVVNERQKKDLLEQIANWQKQQSINSHILDLKADDQGLKEVHV